MVARGETCYVLIGVQYTNIYVLMGGSHSPPEPCQPGLLKTADRKILLREIHSAQEKNTKHTDFRAQ